LGGVLGFVGVNGKKKKTNRHEKTKILWKGAGSHGNQ